MVFLASIEKNYDGIGKINLEIEIVCVYLTQSINVD